MSQRRVAGALPRWTIDVYWHDNAKCWTLVLLDADRRVVEKQTADTRTALDKASARLLLRGTTRELELLLPL